MSRQITYFIQAVSGGRIKIGLTKGDPARRLKHLNLGSPSPLQLLGWVSGDREAELHKRFEDCWSHGEWFEATRELTQFIVQNAQLPESVTPLLQSPLPVGNDNVEAASSIETSSTKRPSPLLSDEEIDPHLPKYRNDWDGRKQNLWYFRRGEEFIGPINMAAYDLAYLARRLNLFPSDEAARDMAGPWIEVRRTPLISIVKMELRDHSGQRRDENGDAGLPLHASQVELVPQDAWPRQTPGKLLVKEAEAARMLSMCEKSVDNLHRRGELPCVRIGRAKFYAIDDLLALIIAKKVS